MARKIKRFFVFLFFSLFFSLLSGRITTPTSQKGKEVKSSACGNTAMAAACCPNGVCESEEGPYCCP